MHSDPTGAAGIIKSTPARAKLNRAKRLLEARRRNTDELESLLRDAARSDTVKDRKDVAKANEPGCEVCARSDKWVPTHSGIGPTTVAGRLDREYLLCSWHYAWVGSSGRLPEPDEEQRHQAGKRVTRRVEPSIGKQTARLIDGLATGKLGA
jgi:hypothetical protein